MGIVSASKQTIEDLFGYGKVLPKYPEDSDLETFLMIQREAYSNSGKHSPSFDFTSYYLSSRARNMDSGQKQEFIADAFEFFNHLMERYDDLRFAVNTFGYLFEKTERMDPKQKNLFLDRAHNFFDIVNGYNDPVFNINFFGYLFEKAEGMSLNEQEKRNRSSEEQEDPLLEKKRDLVYVAARVSHVLRHVKNIKLTAKETEFCDKKELAAFSHSLKPYSRLIEDLGLEADPGDEQYYYLRMFHGSLNDEIKPIGLDGFLRQKTVADCIGYIIKDMEKRNKVR